MATIGSSVWLNGNGNVCFTPSSGYGLADSLQATSHGTHGIIARSIDGWLHLGQVDGRLQMRPCHNRTSGNFGDGEPGLQQVGNSASGPTNGEAGELQHPHCSQLSLLAITSVAASRSRAAHWVVSHPTSRSDIGYSFISMLKDTSTRSPEPASFCSSPIAAIALPKAISPMSLHAGTLTRRGSCSEVVATCNGARG